MRKYASKILAVLLLIGVAQALSACVVYDDDHYYHHRYWHDDDDWHRHRW